MTQSRSIIGLVRRAQKAITAIYEAGWPGELPIPRAHALGALYRFGPLTQTQICDAAAIDRSSLSAMLPMMLTDGLVVRARVESDRRSLLVTITPKGRAAFLKAEKALASVEREVLMAVTQLDRQPLLNALNQVAALAGEP